MPPATLPGAPPATGPIIPAPDAAGAVVQLVAQRSVRISADGSPSLSGPAYPFGLTVDRAGTTYIADRGHRIWQIDATGTIAVFAGTGDSGSVDGPAAMAQFNAPVDIAMDSAGTFYIADLEALRIRRIMADGTVGTFAGSGQPGDVDGPAAAAQFDFPGALTVDAGGNVYVAEALGNRIRKVTPDGTVSTLAGSGQAGSRDGPGAQAQFRGIEAIAVDTRGSVYVADGGNNRIRLIAPDGTVGTLAGSGDSGYADGPAAGAAFRHPTGIAVDKTGIVYVAEWLDERIRELRPDGNVYTLAGFETLPGPSEASVLNAAVTPERIALDQVGDIYFWSLSGLYKVVLPH